MQDTFLKNGFVLSYPNRQRNIVVLGPPAERMKEQHRLLKATLLEETPPSVLKYTQEILQHATERVCFRKASRKTRAAPDLHQQRVPVMYRISQLKGEHRVGAHLPTLCPDLVRRQPVTIQTVVPANPLEDLQVAADQPVAGFQDHLNARVSGVARAELTAAAFLSAMVVKLRIAQDRQVFAAVPEDERVRAGTTLLVAGAHGEDNGDRLVDLNAVLVQAIEVQRLRENRRHVTRI